MHGRQSNILLRKDEISRSKNELIIETADDAYRVTSRACLIVAGIQDLVLSLSVWKCDTVRKCNAVTDVSYSSKGTERETIDTGCEHCLTHARQKLSLVIVYWHYELAECSVLFKHTNRAYRTLHTPSHQANG